MNLEKEGLLLKIDYYREKLIQVGMNKGMTNPETIQLSENLDKLILNYQKL